MHWLKDLKRIWCDETQDGALVLWELLSYCCSWGASQWVWLWSTASTLLRSIGFPKIAIESSNLEFYHAPGLNKSHATYQRSWDLFIYFSEMPFRNYMGLEVSLVPSEKTLFCCARAPEWQTSVVAWDHCYRAPAFLFYCLPSILKTIKCAALAN